MRAKLLGLFLCAAIGPLLHAGAAPRKKPPTPPAEQAEKRPEGAPPTEPPAPPPADALQNADDLEEVRQLDEEVKRHVDAAERHRQAGQHEEAVRELQEAYKLDAQPIFLFKAGQAYQSMGRLKEAIEMYTNFLQQEPQTALRRETEGYISELRARKERESRPLWKKGWFWGVLAGSVVVVAGIGVGLAFGLRGSTASTVMPGE